jgi:hypothetical protein
MTEMSGPELGSHDSEAGVFVMHCWVREDGELAGRVRWSTMDGDQGTTMLGNVTDLVNEAESFLHRVSHGPEGKGASSAE